VSVTRTRSRGGVEVAGRVGLHEEDLRCCARVEVFRVARGSERVRDGCASDATFPRSETSATEMLPCDRVKGEMTAKRSTL